MRKLRNTILSRINMALAYLIAALGVTGCKQQHTVIRSEGAQADTDTLTASIPAYSNEVICMYGLPRASYKVAAHIERESQKPIQAKVYVSTSHEQEGVEMTSISDGTFTASFDGFPVDTLYFTVHTPSGEYSFSEKLEYPSPIDEWNWGTATPKVHFVIPENEIRIKYGVPLPSGKTTPIPTEK